MTIPACSGPLLTSKEVAKILGIHAKSLKNIAGLDPILVGKRPRWRTEDLEKWIRSRETVKMKA